MRTKFRLAFLAREYVLRFVYMGIVYAFYLIFFFFALIAFFTLHRNKLFILSTIYFLFSCSARIIIPQFDSVELNSSVDREVRDEYICVLCKFYFLEFHWRCCFLFCFAVFERSHTHTHVGYFLIL